MNDKDVAKFRGVVRDEINSAIKPIAKKLDTLWDQVIEVTTDLSEVKETLKSHTASLHRIEERNSEDIKKLYKTDNCRGSSRNNFSSRINHSQIIYS